MLWRRGLSHDIIDANSNLEGVNMATSVYETTEMELLNGTVINMRPLKISLLRKFMNKFETIADASESNDKSMDVLMECVGIAMQQYSPDVKMTKTELEDSFDLPMVYKVIEAASGIKMDSEGNAQTGILGLN